MGVRVTGLDEVRERIQRAKAARDLRPFLADEASRIKSMIDVAWTSRRSPSGEVWEPSEGGGGSLRRAHSVEAGRSKITIRVDHPAARFQFFGTSHLPPRNPLPVESDGGAGFRLTTSGPASAFWREHAERLERFLSGDPA